MRNEIGLMEDCLENVVGQQLHLEIEGHGVFDYEGAKLFFIQERAYLLALRLTPQQEGYLMTFDDLGDGWYTLRDILDEQEWQTAKDASGWEDYTGVLHR
ncbi:hypothetical protein OS242_14505 [Tumebacillus sp. DT12]|uniref:DUF5348 domain-containing protein n=1 Tax=Tumebacillus lacus TaxID=2995335 RepID=A0ABT3X2M7_9BACL|nr:hypothetical protein [Tumebacillus lacus]MCX7571160.1 hypothetical protein [Tumebacillus lacus]